MEVETNLTRTSELDKLFNICKNSRVNRLAMLGMTPDKLPKQGKFYMLTPEQVELFADFDQYILLNGTTEGYSKLVIHPPAAPPVELVDIAPPPDSGSLMIAMAAELPTDAAPSESEYIDPSYQPDSFACAQGDRTTQMLVQNAQLRATAILMAENTLAQQYLENPSLLSPKLQAQIGSLQHREIDPKELAASLIASAQSYSNGAA